MGLRGRSPRREAEGRLIIPIPSQSHLLSSVREFGYDYGYGYGYVKSVDSMDNVNSVRCGNGLDNVNSTNSAVIRRRGGAAGRKGALLVLLKFSRPLPQRTLLTLPCSPHS